MTLDPTDKVFDPGRLHEIAITVAPEHLDTLDTWTPEQPRVPCTFTFDGVTIASAGIRRKGGSTWGSAKPGYSVKLDEFVPGQELFGLDRLLLDSAGTDPSFLHEHLGYELYRRAGLPARRTAHGAVTFNGVDKGLFVVAEAHDKKFLRRTFGDGNQGGNLYEGWCCFDFVSRTDRIDLKGEVEEMRSRADLDALIDVILDAPDGRFEELVTARLDLSGFITGYAVDAAVVHWDGYSFQTNNYYLYDDPADGRFVFLPHGMDQLLGDLAADPFVRPKGRLSQRVREIPTLDARFRAEVYRVVDEAWDLPALLARIDQVAAILHATPRSGDATRFDLDSFDRNLGPTREALARRKQTLQDNRTAVCGDGVVQGVEQCDDGNAASEDGCSAACRREWCGDRVVQPGLGEICDDPGCLPDCSGPGRCVTVTAGAASYLVCSTGRSITGARADCAARGGTLAVPPGPARNDLLVSAALGLFPRHYWIGIDDEAAEGSYVRPDGTPATFFAWAPGKPDGVAWEDCVALDADLAGGWNDRFCPEANGYICRLP